MKLTMSPGWGFHRFENPLAPWAVNLIPFGLHASESLHSVKEKIKEMKKIYNIQFTFPFEGRYFSNDFSFSVSIFLGRPIQLVYR